MPGYKLRRKGKTGLSILAESDQGSKQQAPKQEEDQEDCSRINDDLISAQKQHALHKDVEKKRT